MKSQINNLDELDKALDILNIEMMIIALAIDNLENECKNIEAAQEKNRQDWSDLFDSVKKGTMTRSRWESRIVEMYQKVILHSNPCKDKTSAPS